MPRNGFACLVVSLVLLITACSPQPRERPVILAPASMENLLEAIARDWEAEGNDPVVLSYAGTSTHARQVEAGASADLFLSADVEWIDYLAKASLIDRQSVRDIAAGELVLVAPGRKGRTLDMLGARDLDRLLGRDGRLAVADMTAVPAGRYARQALDWLGADTITRERTVESDNVRGALRLVETREAAAAIVYATDAQISRDVHIVYRFPPESHAPIRYQAARLTGSDSDEAMRFLDWLESDSARARLEQFGFRSPTS